MGGGRYLTVEELAERFRVSRWSIYGWVKEGRLPPGERVGQRILFDPDEVDAHVRARAEKQRAAAGKAATTAVTAG